MYKFVLVVLAVAATCLADTQQVLKTHQTIMPANAAYVPYATGYTAGAAAVYPQYQHYQQFAQYPAGYAQYAAYPGYQQYQGYQGYNGYVSPMAYAPVSTAAHAYPYAAAPVVYQQKHVAATPAHAYSVL